MLTALFEKAQKASAAKKLIPLLAAWEKSPTPELADVILAVDAAHPPAPFEGDVDDWVTAAKKGPEWRGALLAAWKSPKLGDCHRRIEAATKWGPDPRSSKALETLLIEAPWTSSSSRPLWNAVFEWMTKLGDPRFAQLAKTLPAAWQMRADQKAWLERALAKAAAKVPASTTPLTPGEAKALSAVKALLTPIAPRPKSGGHNEEALLADIYENPADDAPRLVLADFLQEKSDPRGEFISLQISGADAKREKALLKLHGKKWLGALAPVLGAQFEFRRGFVAVGMAKFRHLADAEKYGALPEWATLEELTWSHPNPPPRGQEPGCRFIGPAMKHLKIARGPWVPHLLAAKDPWALEQLETSFMDVANFHALFESKLFPRLHRLNSDDWDHTPLWLARVTSFGAVKSLGFKKASREMLDALNRTPLAAAQLGDTQLTRGADGCLSRITVTTDRIHNPDVFPAKLPDGAFESVTCEDATLRLLFEAKLRKRGAKSPWSSGPKGPEQLGSLEPVRGLGFTANGKWLVAGNEAVQIVEPKDQTVLFQFPTNQVRAAVLTPDCSTLVTSTWRNVSVYDVATGKPRASFASENEGGSNVGIGTDGHTIRVGSTGELWDLNTGKLLRAGKKGAGFKTIAFDGSAWVRLRKFAAPLEVYTAASKKPVLLADSAVQIFECCFLPDGRLFATTPSKNLLLWDPATGALLKQRTIEEEPSGPASFSPDGTWFAVPSKSIVFVFDLRTFEPISQIKAGEYHQGSAWSRDSKQLLVAGKVGGRLGLFDARTGKPL